MKMALAIILLALVPVSCGLSYPKEPTSGPEPLHAEAVQRCKTWFEQHLRDPLTAEYRWSPFLIEVPADAFDDIPEPHWMLIAQCNSKNGFGVYGGFETFYFRFRESRLIWVSQQIDYPGVKASVE